MFFEFNKRYIAIYNINREFKTRIYGKTDINELRIFKWECKVVSLMNYKK